MNTKKQKQPLTETASPAFSFILNAPHPFACLRDWDSARPFMPRPNHYALVVFVTAQQYFDQSHDMFLAMRDFHKRLVGDVDGALDMLAVMPSAQFQNDPDNFGNLHIAQDLHIRPLTGASRNIWECYHNLVRDKGEATYALENGKFIDHPTCIVLLNPEGENVAEYDYRDIRDDKAEGEKRDLFKRTPALSCSPCCG